MKHERHGRSGLSWFEAGDASGPVVVYFHGTPKATEDFAILDVAETLGVRLLAVDRPGYGTSPRRPGLTLSDLGRAIVGDLDDLGVDRFSVLGWSGGGPHALGCAAVAPSRVGAAGLLASWAPMNPPGRGLPLGVRFAMRVGAALPRSASVRIVAWHTEGDRQVPAAPWRDVDGIELNVLSGDSHDVSPDLWEIAIRSVSSGDAPT